MEMRSPDNNPAKGCPDIKCAKQRMIGVVRSIVFLFRKLQPSFARRLNIAFVVTSNSIANCNKIEVIWIEHVVMLGSHLKQPFSEPVIILFLLRSVVHVGVLEVFVSVANQEALQL
mgnify:CR=1 FL=1